jgi:hypothetical protein
MKQKDNVHQPERWHYAYAGLRVTSELSLPEWNVFEGPQPFDDPDVVISLNHAQEQTQLVEKFHIVHPKEYYFFIPDAGEYRVRHGREIVVTPAPGAGAREIRLFLLGSAWGALCYQRGLLFLHASVVRVGDNAIAICGPTGSGKSTLAAWLTDERGYLLMSDDLCRFEITAEGQARVYPSAPRLKLWRDALTALRRSDEGLERDHYRLDKYHLDLTDFQKPVRSISSPLRGIYLLDWGEVDLTRLTGATALHRLVKSATYRGDLLEPMNQVAAHWQRCAELAQRVPIFQFTRPRNWSAMEAAVGLLMAHWRKGY